MLTEINLCPDIWDISGSGYFLGRGHHHAILSRRASTLHLTSRAPRSQTAPAMGNRVYLSFTNFDHYPSSDELEQFRGHSGDEFEARASIPLFWVCLFDAQHLVALSAEGRPYPGLLAGKHSALLTARRRLAVLGPHLGPLRVQLYQQWLKLVSSQPTSHLMVATFELDWMDSEGCLEKDLRRAFDVLDGPDRDLSDITGDWRLASLLGLPHHRMLNECESLELVTGAAAWPEPFTPAAQPQIAADQHGARYGNTWRNVLSGSSLPKTLFLFGISVTLAIGGMLMGLGGEMKGYVIAVFFGLGAILPTLQLQERWRDARRSGDE